MPSYRFIVLDSYPLGNAALAPPQPGRQPTQSELCLQWMVDCEAAGVVLVVPAIAYYEEVRDLYQRQATVKIARFQNFCFDADRFVPLTSAHLTHAGELWGAARRTGQATSDHHALDGDAILAAQVLSLNLSANEYVVATRNPGHLSRFGLPVSEWESIVP